MNSAIVNIVCDQVIICTGIKLTCMNDTEGCAYNRSKLGARFTVQVHGIHSPDIGIVRHSELRGRMRKRRWRLVLITKIGRLVGEDEFVQMEGIGGDRIEPKRERGVHLRPCRED